MLNVALVKPRMTCAQEFPEGKDMFCAEFHQAEQAAQMKILLQTETFQFLVLFPSKSSLSGLQINVYFVFSEIAASFETLKTALPLTHASM